MAASTNASTPPPIGFMPLVMLALGVFLGGLLIFEAVDPRFTGQRKASPLAQVTPIGSPIRPVPTLRPRRPTAVVAVAEAAGSPVPVSNQTEPATAAPEDSIPSPPIIVVVAGTSGIGARLRMEPGPMGAVLRVLDDGEQLIVGGEEAVVDGRRWVDVRTPDGEHGWVAADLLEVVSGG